MTAARHDRPPAVARAALIIAARVLIALAAAAGLAITWRSGANTIAHPWHYPCHEHLVHLGRLAIEFFTPNRLFMRGGCLQ